MNNEDLADLKAIVRDLYTLNITIATELAALRALTRALALQPSINRSVLHLAATTLLDAAIAELPPEQQCTDTLAQAQRFLDGLLPAVD